MPEEDIGRDELLTGPTDNVLIQSHLLVSGRVTGVGYRFFAVRTAKRLGISGWIKNRRDGQVETVVVGPKAAVGKMMVWLRKGSPASRIDRVARLSAGPIAQDRYHGRFSVIPSD